jgi:hypothetical protein
MLWSPLLQLMSLFLKLRPGISLHFLSQNMLHKEPEKKMPSTAANTFICSAKLVLVELHHLMMWSRCNISIGSLMQVAMRRKQWFAVDFDCNLEAVEASGFECHYFGGKIAAYILVDDTIGGNKEC